MLVQSIRVAGKMKRRGIGKKIWGLSMLRAESRGSVKWVFVSPTVNQRDCETLEIYQKQESAAFAFWRSLGLRRVDLLDWFCYAEDQKHPSRSLLAEDDVDPPKAGAENAVRCDSYPDRIPGR